MRHDGALLPEGYPALSSRTLQFTDAFYDYMHAVSLREPEILARLRAETAKHPRARMQISPEQGQFMRLLIELPGVRRVIEIGVFTGYGGLSMALALPPDGKLIGCDVSEEFSAVDRTATPENPRIFNSFRETPERMAQFI